MFFAARARRPARTQALTLERLETRDAPSTAVIGTVPQVPPSGPPPVPFGAVALSTANIGVVSVAAAPSAHAW
jgi:hypothetical protein